MARRYRLRGIEMYELTDWLLGHPKSQRTRMKTRALTHYPETSQNSTQISLICTSGGSGNYLNYPNCLKGLSGWMSDIVIR